MTDYDPQNTMLALNMAAVSVSRIIASQERAILEWEYSNIINNLALGNIRSDPEMTGLYDELMEFIVGKELREQEKEQIRQSFKLREQEAWYRSMADARSESAGLFGWVKNKIVSGISRLTGSNFITSYYGVNYKYSALKAGIQRSDNDTLWQLTKAEIEACNKLQRKLLRASWILMDRYGLADEYRLTPESLEAFFSAVSEERPSERLNMLKVIEHCFLVYPPYWFLCAQTAFEAGQEAEGKRYVGKFNEVWKPVLRKDPMKVEAVKFRIREIGRGGIPSVATAEEVKGLLKVMEKYKPLEDWSTNLFRGITYFILGDFEQSRRLVKANLQFGYEKEISGAVLSRLETGKLETAKLTAGLHWLFEKDIENLTYIYWELDNRRVVYWHCKSAEPFVLSKPPTILLRVT